MRSVGVVLFAFMLAAPTALASPERDARLDFSRTVVAAGEPDPRLPEAWQCIRASAVIFVGDEAQGEIDWGDGRAEEFPISAEPFGHWSREFCHDFVPALVSYQVCFRVTGEGFWSEPFEMTVCEDFGSVWNGAAPELEYP